MSSSSKKSTNQLKIVLRADVMMSGCRRKHRIGLIPQTGKWRQRLRLLLPVQVSRPSDLTSGATCWVFVSWLRPSHADAACAPGKHVTGLPSRGHWFPGTEHSWWMFSVVCRLGHLCLHPDGEVVGVAPRPWAQLGLLLTCGEQDPCGHRDTEQKSHCPTQQLPQCCRPSAGEWGLEPQGPRP